MKRLATLISVLLATLPSWSQEFPDAVPLTRDKTSWAYSVVSSVIYNVDKTLQKAGINGEVCTFRNLRTGTTKNFSGMGPCLYENFMESMKTKGLAGVIYVWVRSQAEMRVLRLDWRPSEEGWKKIIKEIIDLEFESWQLDKNKTADEKPLSYQQNFLGKITISIPSGRSFSEYLPVQHLEAILPASQTVSKINFEMIPVHKKQGVNIYRGQVSLQGPKTFLSEEQNGSSSMTLDFTTNINILKTKRVFSVEGNIGS